MPTMDTATHDYTTGVPRHHHSLYLEDGNFVMQIENAIFKIHRSVLAKYSSVIGDMLNAPQGKTIGGGIHENPLVVTGDSVQGWELLLGWRYESPLFSSKHALSGEQLLSVLPIAHKYCMEEVEENILGELNSVLSTAGYVDLMVAAQIIGSDPFYRKALNALKTAKPALDLAQSKRIGVESTHAILTAALATSPPIGSVIGQFAGRNRLRTLQQRGQKGMWLKEFNQRSFSIHVWAPNQSEKY